MDDLKKDLAWSQVKKNKKIEEVAKASRRLPRIEGSIEEAQVGFFRWFEKRGWKLMWVWFVEGAGCC